MHSEAARVSARTVVGTRSTAATASSASIERARATTARWALVVTGSVRRPLPRGPAARSRLARWTRRARPCSSTSAREGRAPRARPSTTTRRGFDDARAEGSVRSYYAGPASRPLALAASRPLRICVAFRARWEDSRRMPLRLRLRRGGRARPRAARRQGSGPRGDDRARHPGPGRLHRHDRGLRRVHARRKAASGRASSDEIEEHLGRLEERRGQALRRPERSAARLRSLGRGGLDAGDDGHDPEPRPERRGGRGARRARPGTSASPTTPTGGSSRCTATSSTASDAYRFEDELERAEGAPRRHARTSSSTADDLRELVEPLQGDLPRGHRARTSRRTRASSSSARSGPSSTPGRRRARRSTGARTRSRTTSARP